MGQRHGLRGGRRRWAAAFSPDGRFILGAGFSGDVTLWDADTLEEVRVLGGHTDAVFGIAFGPDRLLVTASRDGTDDECSQYLHQERCPSSS